MDKNKFIVNFEEKTSELPVSIQTYQAIYNELTGKTEKIIDSYDDYYRLIINDLINLKQRFEQFSEQYHVEGTNSSITIFHTKGSKEVFSSFERLTTYNAANPNSIEQIHIEINYLFILPKVNKPQSYKITITFVSGIAFMDKYKNELPKSLPLSFVMRAAQEKTIDVTIEYVDYIVARGISDLLREWIYSLDKVEPNKTIQWLQDKSNTIKKLISFAFLFLSVYFSARYTDRYFAAHAISQSFMVKYLIYSFFAILMTTYLGDLLGERVEESIDSVNIDNVSIIEINAGDAKLREKHEKNKKDSIVSLVKEIAISFIVGVLSSLMASYLLR